MPKMAGKPSKSGKRLGKYSSTAFRTYTDFRLASRKSKLFETVKFLLF